jgi:hypothetical protein
VQWKHQLTLTESNEGKYYLVIKQGEDEQTKRYPDGINRIKIIKICSNIRKRPTLAARKRKSFSCNADKKKKR